MTFPRILSALLLAAAGFAATARAATITVDGAGLRGVHLYNSPSMAPSGSRVMVGYFDGMTDADIVTNQLNRPLLQSKWISFGLGGTIGQGVGGAAGHFTFDTSASVEQPGATFTGPAGNDQIYLWIFNSSIATDATQHAIFTIQGAVGTMFGATTEWHWPLGDDGFTDRSVSLDDSLEMLVGSTNANGLYLNPVPEPGQVGLLVIGALTLLARFSRRR